MTTPQYKILIVDDDEFLLNMYSIKFKKEGLEVDTAAGSTVALEKFKSGIDPDVLLIDVVMPNMDGIELLGEIKKNGWASKATIIMLTNQSSQQDIDRATKLGVDGYIVKASSIPSEVLTEVLKIAKEHRKD